MTLIINVMKCFRFNNRRTHIQNIEMYLMVMVPNLDTTEL